jgi:S-formylglutathione hydrolase FrmB
MISGSPTTQAIAAKATLLQMTVVSAETDIPIRKIWVLTPAVPPDQIDLLPVVYMLHGWPGTPQGLIAGVRSALLTGFANGAAPFIAVFPDGNAITHADSEWADSSDGRAKIETWLTTSVIQTVEGENLRTRDDRAIMGFSMGGYGAAIIGLHHPELFGQVVTLAGYFQIDDLTNAFGTGPSSAKKLAYQTPASFLKVASKDRWFLGKSSQDYTVLIRGQASSWGRRLKSVKASYTLSNAAGGHSYVFVANEIPQVLKWFKWAVMTSPTPSAQPTPTDTSLATEVPAKN